MRKITFFRVQQIDVMVTTFKDPSVGDVAYVNINSPKSCATILVIAFI